MANLREIQKKFMSAIYGDDEQIYEHITETSIEKGKRIDIYRQGIFINLTSTLMNTYPLLVNLVDERFFKYAANEFIKQHKPTSGNLDDYGMNIAEFLEEFTPTKELKYLPDIAKLEWLKHKAYMADDHNCMDKTRLSKITEEQMQNLAFVLHPTVGIIKSQYPIYSISLVADPGYTEEIDVDVNAKGENVLIIRPEYKIETYQLSDSEYLLLESMQKGVLLTEALAKIIKVDKQFILGKTINQFINNGAIVDFKFLK